MSITVVLFSRDKGKYVEIKEREMKVKKKKKKEQRDKDELKNVKIAKM